MGRTRPTLEQRVETCQWFSKTRSNRQSEKDKTEQTTQLLGRELKSIAEQMTKVSSNSTQVDKERAPRRWIKLAAIGRMRF